MKLFVQKASLLQGKTHVLVAAVFDDLVLGEELEHIDKELNHAITKRMKLKSFTDPLSIVSVSTNGKFEFDQIVVISLGKKSEANLELLRNASALIAKIVRDSDWKNFSTNMHFTHIDHLNIFDRTQAVAEGIFLALYQFNVFKTMDVQKIRKLNEAVLLSDEKSFNDVQNAIHKAQILCENVNLARDLANLPPIDKTPSVLAQKFAKLCKENGIKIRTFDKKACVRKKFNALLAVNAGSMEEPRMCVMEYTPSKFKKTIALVGKGITFDSGGLSLKPSSGMESMKSDMTGAAQVMALMIIAKQLKLPVKIVGVVAITENMPGNKAIKPGDIITGYSGKTIEILNTDAEGRMVLSDALTLAKEFSPDALIDIATLTGAAVVALGRYYSAGFTNNQELLQKVMNAAQFSGERLWQLPLSQEHKDFMKSDFADLRNTSKGPTGEAGASNAAAFLSYFVETTPWVHLDIAPTDFLLEPDKYRQYVVPGSSGIMIRTLARFLEEYK
ncbi:MAG: leucyl aminopeptidase [archaeon]|nr:leucyl aminopeptidase [archaeon]